MPMNNTEKEAALKGLSTAEAHQLLQRDGRNELVEKTTPKWKLFVRQFTGPMPIGIWLAIIVELILQNIPDAMVLVVLQFLNGMVGFMEENKSGNAIASLKASLKPTAQVKRDGTWIKIDAAELVVGDLVMLSSGAAVPADCVVVEGMIHVDQAAMTGESLPVKMNEGDAACMGSTVVRGEAEALIESTGMNTMYGKTAALLQLDTNTLGELDRILLRIIIRLMALSTLFCAISFLYVMLKGEPLKSAISFNVVLLIASIPLAIEVVVTATLALGSRELSAHNAIVAHLTSIERLAGMRVLCSDKTGTLTLNTMMIQEEIYPFGENVDKDSLILHAALAAKWNEPAKDALDTMILKAANIEKCNEYKQIEYIPFESDRKRTEATICDQSGHEFTVIKGAAEVIAALCHDNEQLIPQVDQIVTDLAGRGIRSLAVACTNAEGNMTMLGLLSFLDPPRFDAKETIAKAESFGVKVMMITGDHDLVAKETAKVLQLGSANIVPCTEENLPLLDLQDLNGEIPPYLGETYGEMIESCDGFSHALPEHKFLIVEALKQRGVIVGMTGDGVNDAPALKSAHVGVAVQGATDAARAAADIVLTSPGLNAIIEAILIARRIFTRTNSFLIYRVAATIQLLLFFFVAIIFLHPKSYNAAFPDFWAMPVISLITITVLNDGTIISIAYDNVKASKLPQQWNMRRLWSMSFCLGIVACASSLLLLHLAMNSTAIASSIPFLGTIGFNSLSYGQVITIMYLKVSLSDFMTLFSARTGVDPFFSTAPSAIVSGAGMLAVTASTLIALFWPFHEDGPDAGAPISIAICTFVWIYCIVWFFIQDAIKVMVFKIIPSKQMQSPAQRRLNDLKGISVREDAEWSS